MKYRQQRREAFIHLDIEDLTAIKEMVEFGPAHERLSTHVYRDRVETCVRGLVEKNPVLQKLQAGELVSDAEVRELADLLEKEDPFVTENLLRKVYDHRTARFLQFILRDALQPEVAGARSVGGDEPLLDVDEASRLLNMTPGALRKAVARGTLPCRRIRRRLRFDREALMTAVLQVRGGLVDGGLIPSRSDG